VLQLTLSPRPIALTHELLKGLFFWIFGVTHSTFAPFLSAAQHPPTLFCLGVFSWRPGQRVDHATFFSPNGYFFSRFSLARVTTPFAFFPLPLETSAPDPGGLPGFGLRRRFSHHSSRPPVFYGFCTRFSGIFSFLTEIRFCDPRPSCRSHLHKDDS